MSKGTENLLEVVRNPSAAFVEQMTWIDPLGRISLTFVLKKKKKTFYLLPLVVRILRTRLIDLFLEQDHILDFSEIAGITSVLR